MCLNDLCSPRPFCSYYNDRIAFRGATSKGGRLVPSRHLCVFGVRDDWGLGWGARGVMGRTDTTRAPQPNPQSSLSPQKHINNDWIRVCKGGAVVRALASHQCCSGSNPSVDAICALSLFLVLSIAPRGSGYSGFPISLKTNTFKFQFELNARTRLSKFLWTP